MKRKRPRPAPVPVGAEADRSEILVSLRTVSEYLDVSTVQINKLCREGVLPYPKARGQYDLRACVRCYVQYQRGLLGQSGERVSEAYHEERTRLTRTRADLEELKRQELEGEVVRVDEIETTWGHLMDVLRVTLLALPTKVAARLSSCRTAVEAQAMLRREVNDALGRISTYRFIPANGGSPSTGGVTPDAAADVEP